MSGSADAALRRAVIDRDFARMNDCQRQAVTCTEGPLLILAGAGSGKTTVLVNRAALLVKYGRAYSSDTDPVYTEEQRALLRACAAGERPVDEQAAALCAEQPCPPYRILTITFTNKAAGELKDRLERMLGPQGRDVVASTFHSFCARMMREYGERLGYSRRFSIYDGDDSARLMKECIKELGIESMTPKAVLHEIGRAKDQLLLPDAYADRVGADFRLRRVAQLYQLYQNRLRQADAMDFDDLLLNAVRLLETADDVRETYQRRFRYLMVDEYQDTNYAQYRLISLLAAGSGNLCVVGDDDQSIYRFRGATIKNILNFEEEFTGCRVIRLEQNYRSTKTILDAANAVIARNTKRMEKSLWTENARGERICDVSLDDEQQEAAFIADTVVSGVAAGRSWKDYAVLYRMNAQSNTLEQALVKSGVPYRIVGGHRFTDSQEIRDVAAYLRVLYNPADQISLRRIINQPRRGIGEATVQAAVQAADGMGLTLYEVLQHAADYPSVARSAAKTALFFSMMDRLRALAEDPQVPVHELYQQVLEQTGYLKMWQDMGESEQERVENLREFASSILQYEQECGPEEPPTLGGFLENYALMTDIDNYDADAPAVVLMTMHAAKGLEFPVVFLPGFEEGIFPSQQSLFTPEDLEEDRRLCYVAITRAKEQLYLLHTAGRMLFGNTMRNRPSRFMDDIPDRLLDRQNRRRGVPAYGWGTSGLRGRSFQDGARRFDDDDQTPHFRPAPRAAAGLDISVLSTQKPAAAPGTAYEPGQVVRHKVFGRGVVRAAKPMGGDTMLTVVFDGAGEKRIMANYAKLEKE